MDQYEATVSMLAIVAQYVEQLHVDQYEAAVSSLGLQVQTLVWWLGPH